MIAKEYLIEQKNKYQDRQDYFKKLGFDVLASDFHEVIDLIEKMEEFLKTIDENT